VVFFLLVIDVVIDAAFLVLQELLMGFTFFIFE
jgi:hypothetical protein